MCLMWNVSNMLSVMQSRVFYVFFFAHLSKRNSSATDVLFGRDEKEKQQIIISFPSKKVNLCINDDPTNQCHCHKLDAITLNSYHNQSYSSDATLQRDHIAFVRPEEITIKWKVVEHDISFEYHTFSPTFACAALSSRFFFKIHSQYPKMHKNLGRQLIHFPFCQSSKFFFHCYGICHILHINYSLTFIVQVLPD